MYWQQNCSDAASSMWQINIGKHWLWSCDETYSWRGEMHGFLVKLESCNFGKYLWRYNLLNVRWANIGMVLLLNVCHHWQWWGCGSGGMGMGSIGLNKVVMAVSDDCGCQLREFTVEYMSSIKSGCRLNGRMMHHWMTSSGSGKWSVKIEKVTDVTDVTYSREWSCVKNGGDGWQYHP